MGNTNNSNQTGIDHPKLNIGTVTIFKQLIVDYKFNENYQIWQQNVRETKKIVNQENSLYLPQIQLIEKQNFCGNSKQLKLIFQIYPFTLYQQILKRKYAGNFGQPFNQQQLWYLLYELVNSSRIFQARKVKLGDIRPKNILINQSGEISIINILTFPDELTNYQKSFRCQTITYLAPQQLIDLENQKEYSKADPSAAQSFSIGLTILDAALLVDCETMYSLDPFRFKNNIFRQYLTKWKQLKMSPFLIKTVSNMLQINVLDRPTPGQTYSIIFPYHQQILKLQQFIPNKQKSRISLQNYQKRYY